MWLGQKCPGRLGSILGGLDLDPLVDGPGAFHQVLEDSESDLDTRFQHHQENVVKSRVLDLLGNPYAIGGNSLRVLELETRAALACRQNFDTPHGLAQRYTIDQALAMRPWHELLGELPAISGAWVSWKHLWVGFDVLVWYRNSWHGILIRASTKIKDSHIAEAELARTVFQEAGLSLGSVFLVNPSETYRRGETFDASKAFAIHGLNTHVKHLRKPLSQLWPEILIGARAGEYCNKRSCPHCKHILPPLPEHSIYSLHKGGRAVQLLEQEGKIDLRDLSSASPEALGELTDHQRIQLEAIAKGTRLIQTAKLRSFLSSITYPVSFLDFECTSQALPPFEGVQPWEHIPFLLSLQKLLSPHELATMDLLPTIVAHGQPGEDARSILVDALLTHVPEEGSIAGYGIALEKMVLTRLAAMFPDARERLNSIKNRMIDLQEPFAHFWYYHPEQKGKISLKKILPLLSALDHQDLILKNGGQAHLYWSALSDPSMLAATGSTYFTLDAVGTRIEEIKDYAALDALGLVHVFKSLQDLTVF